VGASLVGQRTLGFPAHHPLGAQLSREWTGHSSMLSHHHAWSVRRSSREPREPRSPPEVHCISLAARGRHGSKRRLRHGQCAMREVSPMLVCPRLLAGPYRSERCFAVREVPPSAGVTRRGGRIERQAGSGHGEKELHCSACRRHAGPGRFLPPPWRESVRANGQAANLEGDTLLLRPPNERNCHSSARPTSPRSSVRMVLTPFPAARREFNSFPHCTMHSRVDPGCCHAQQKAQ
jgi:hypothetical protein